MLCDWLRLRSEKPPSPKSASTSQLSKAFIAEYSRRCSLEEHLTASRLTDISLVSIGNAGSTGNVRVSGRSRLRSKLGGKWDGEATRSNNDTSLVSPFPADATRAATTEKSGDSVASCPAWASDYVGRSWDRPYMERMRELPPHLMAELKGSFRGNATKHSTASELVYSRLSTVMAEWKLRPIDVNTILSLAYDILDFARTACACRLLLAATYEYPGPVMHSKSSSSHYINGVMRPGAETKDLAVDDESPIPANRPQVPFVLRKAEARGLVKREPTQEGTLGGLISPENSDDEEGDVDSKPGTSQGVNVGKTAVETRPLHPLDRVRVDLEGATIYKDHVTATIARLTSSHSSADADNSSVGVLSMLYPDWSAYSKLTNAMTQSSMAINAGAADLTEVERLRGEFRRRVSSSKHRFWCHISPSASSSDANVMSEAALVFEAEFVGLYYFLSLELRISSKEFHSLRRVFHIC